MEITRRQRQTETATQIRGGGASFMAVVIVLLAVVAGALSGCSNVTVIRLAEMCHQHDGHPNASFIGESGKVECVK